MANMAFHVIGLTRDQFFSTGGSTCELIIKALSATSWRSMQLAARAPLEYPAKTILEVFSLAAFEDGALPEGFEAYEELFFFNNPALFECQAAGMTYPVIREISAEQIPPRASIICRVPVYLHRDVVANLKTP